MIRFARATTADIDTLVTIKVDAMTPRATTMDEISDIRSTFDRRMNRHGYDFFKAVGADSVPGFCSVLFGDGIAVLGDLYVRPAQQGQGIGRRLFRLAVGMARFNGCTKMSWVSSNETREDYHFFANPYGVRVTDKNGLSFVCATRPLPHHQRRASAHFRTS